MLEETMEKETEPTRNSPSGQRGRPKDPARRGEIVRAARQLFLENGVAAVSMDGIAQDAGVSKKTIYSHFANKEELLIEVIMAEAALFEITELASLAVRDHTQLRRQLIAIATSFATMLSQPGIIDLCNLLTAESRRHPEIIKKFMKFGPEDKHGRVAAFLKRAHDAGLLAIPEPEVSADHFLSLCQGLWLFKQRLGVIGPPDAAWIEAQCTKAVDLFLRGHRVEK